MWWNVSVNCLKRCAVTLNRFTWKTNENVIRGEDRRIIQNYKSIIWYKIEIEKIIRSKKIIRKRKIRSKNYITGAKQSEKKIQWNLPIIN